MKHDIVILPMRLCRLVREIPKLDPKTTSLRVTGSSDRLRDVVG
jgi:hypothetical protein